MKDMLNVHHQHSTCKLYSAESDINIVFLNQHNSFDSRLNPQAVCPVYNYQNNLALKGASS